MPKILSPAKLKQYDPNHPALFHLNLDELVGKM